MNKTKNVKEGTWVVKQSTALSSLTIGPTASVAAPEGKSVTMTVDGIGTAIKPGTYNGDIFLTVTESFLIQPGGLYRRSKPQAFRVGILIEDGKYVAEKSVPAIVQGGKVTDWATDGVTIYGCEESFNGIFVTGDSVYNINNVKIDFEGDGANDFIAYGAGITAVGNAKVTINNADIKIKGVTRCAFHAGGNSVTTLNNCYLSNESPVTDKMAPLWVLGLSGTNRATQLCDYATVYYNNCYIYSNGWGSLSIDGGVKVRMFLKDSTIDLLGPRARGYGAFSIGDALISFDHSICNVQGYPLLVCNGDGEFTNGSTINSTLYGIMIFRSKGSKVEVDKGTTFNTASSTFLVKGANAYINVDNANLNPANGVILQLMDSDEPGMGPDKFVVPIGEVDVPIPGRNLTKMYPEEDVFLTISNTEICGDFYNSTTNLMANCREKAPHTPLMSGMPEVDAADGPAGESEEHPRMDNTALQGVKNLEIKFVNARIKGIISAANAAYKEGVKVINASNLKELSAVTQTAAPPINNGVNISFDKDCVWTVTGTSYLTSLTVADGAVIKSPEGKTLTLTVDGVKQKITSGTYSGKIVLKVS